MRYLEDGPFQGHKTIDEEKTIGEVFAEVASSYVPIEGMVLKTAEIRKLNKSIDVFEAGPEDGYFALEDEDFNVLKRVLVTLVESTNLARSAPDIEDILNGAMAEKPSVLKKVV